MADIGVDASKLERLSNRQREVLLLRGAGKSRAQIAEELVITEQTVQYHLGNVYEKLALPVGQEGRALRTKLMSDYADVLIKSNRPPDPAGHGSALAQDGDDSDEIEEEPSGRFAITVLEDEIDLIRRSSTALVPREPAEIWVDPPWVRPRHGKWMALMVLGAAFVLGMVVTAGAQALWQQVQGDDPQVAAASVIEGSVPTPIERLAEESEASEAYEPVCGEAKPAEHEVGFVFLQSQGVISYSKESTNGAVLSNVARALAVDERGLWAGYFATEADPASGLGFTTKDSWLDCSVVPGIANQNINDVAIDGVGRVWVATESAGVSVFDGHAWRTYTEGDGLPSNKTYGLTVDQNGLIWLATWEGVAVFDGERWDVPYSVQNGTLVNNHIHAVTADSAGNIWIGYINAGVSRYDNSAGEWHHYKATTDGLSSDNVRDILIQPSSTGAEDIVWIATDGGGVSQYHEGVWSNDSLENGLPHETVMALEIDQFDRVWAATAGGVVYWNGQQWVLYHTLAAHDVAFGFPCEDCPIGEEHVWTATVGYGLTYSRIPLPGEVVDVLEVRHPPVVAPGQEFRPEIVIVPRSPYELREDRGDALMNTDDESSHLFGAWPHMPVDDTVLPGEPFVFTDYDNPFVAPMLAEGEEERTFTSTWRVWMHTRYVGPPIPITFTVRRDAAAVQ